ncbi:diguanylate cyclase [Stutzerimonas kirkiae]|uniref:Diguanylate cyclase DosC n=1 Tax=Stutzerimonas kirkiae TaxID=2211392 RepID=A0A4Q9RCB4_9GAMM|nr:diguanylate cyclase [Stutzerimonas kirkiae]TBU98643.1 diguanylate cyclase [Stutzerimonas kirkiae]TBV00261.1 diguanylate cyclase [Stutzerimonas kirkiae]TBV06092.1 diguanylate cyclase [Stutzerimonas kirkiae]TBV14248.1 diguanylate cyclase [Stutzerimonas kirkiae]
MQQISNEELSQEWTSLVERFSPQAASILQETAKEKSADLARHFYAYMLSDSHSASFLSHEQVKTRLSKSMQQWVITVFTPIAQIDDLQTVIDLQRKIGEVHARIELPVSLVLRGSRVLKERLRHLLALRGLSDELYRETICLGSDIIDLAIEIICFAFSQSHDRNSRAEEAYRLFSVSQNIGTEKERQRGALLDWENQLMFDLAMGNTGDNLPKLASSEFGLWFRHKASHAFQSSPESESILEYIRQIDTALQDIPDGQQPGSDHGLSVLREIRQQTRAIKFLLDTLFEQANDLEAGRDVLTRLLNRKFLPVVMSKEILYSRQSSNTFGVLAIDVDHFKTINDRYGHDAGDSILQQVATLLAGNTRGGDYAFRLGGEEFLVVLVDINPEKGIIAAEKLRESVARERFKLPQGGDLKVTISIGMAVHNGHPDYEKLLQQADQALYQAKATGRNRSVLYK